MLLHPPQLLAGCQLAFIHALDTVAERLLDIANIRNLTVKTADLNGCGMVIPKISPKTDRKHYAHDYPRFVIRNQLGAG